MYEDVMAAEDVLYMSRKMLRLTLDTVDVTLRFVGTSAKSVAALIGAHWKNSTNKEMGEISLKAMVKRKEPFDMIALSPADAEKFQNLAKQTGLLYSMAKDTQDYDGIPNVDGLTSVLYRQQDAPLVKSMLERLQIHTLCSSKTEKMQERIRKQEGVQQEEEKQGKAESYEAVTKKDEPTAQQLQSKSDRSVGL